MARPAPKPRETSIDRAKPSWKDDGRVRLDWYVTLPDGATKRASTAIKAVRRGGHVRKAETEAALRARAHARADAMLSAWDEAHGAKWGPSSPTINFIDEVSEKAMTADASRLRKRTIEAYRARQREVRQAVEATQGLTLGDLGNAQVIVDLLTAVNEACGTEAAKGARKWLHRYVLVLASRHGAISGDPIAGEKWDDLFIPVVHKGHKPAGRQAIPTADHDKVIAWLVADDPTLARVKGRLTPEQAIRRRLTLTRLTLLQSTCGLRLHEALSLTGADVSLSGSIVVVHIAEDVAKNHRERDVPVVWPDNPKAEEALREWLLAVPDTRPVFPTVTDPTKPWRQDNVYRALTSKRADRRLGLYPEMADDLGIPKLREVATHVWRATLTTRWLARGMSREQVAALLGHSEEVSRESYTGVFQPEELARAVEATRVQLKLVS